MQHSNAYFSRSCLTQMRRKVLKRGKIASGWFPLHSCPLPNEKLTRTDFVFKERRDMEIFTRIVSRHQPWGQRLWCQTEGEHVEKGNACFQGRGKCVSLQLLIITDLNKKKHFGDSLNPWEELCLHLRAVSVTYSIPDPAQAEEWLCSTRTEKLCSTMSTTNCALLGTQSRVSHTVPPFFNRLLCPSGRYSKKLMISFTDYSFSEPGYRKAKKISKLKLLLAT